MVADNELKMCISDLYFAMAKSCKNYSNNIKNDLENYKIQPYHNMGLELNYHGTKYQLVLELKEVLEEK